MSTDTPEAREKLWSMMKEVRVAMLTTSDGGTLRARPMIASQKGFDGTLWFLTRASSHKAAEVEGAPQVGVTYADSAGQNYVSLSGTARMVRDRPSIEAHWSEAARVWFPKGLEEPDLALLRVDVEGAEYWDAPNGTMLMAYGYIKARLTGEPPHPGGHATVRLA